MKTDVFRRLFFTASFCRLKMEGEYRISCEQDAAEFCLIGKTERDVERKVKMYADSRPQTIYYLVKYCRNQAKRRFAGKNAEDSCRVKIISQGQVDNKV